MNLKFLQLPESERKLYIDQAAIQRNVSPIVFEKDFWVSWVLDLLFNGFFLLPRQDQPALEFDERAGHDHKLADLIEVDELEHFQVLDELGGEGVCDGRRLFG